MIKLRIRLKEKPPLEVPPGYTIVINGHPTTAHHHGLWVGTVYPPGVKPDTGKFPNRVNAILCDYKNDYPGRYPVMADTEQECLEACIKLANQHAGISAKPRWKWTP